VVGGEVCEGKTALEGVARCPRLGNFLEEGFHAVAPDVGADPRDEPAVGAGEGGQVERERDGGAVQRFRQSVYEVLPERGLRRGVVDPSDEIEGAQVPIHEACRHSAASMREA
jgi:hypothetical protein